jgi:hypothetical protein
MVIKYRGALYRYIQTKMDFLYISSLGATYRYVVKIEKTFKQQKKWDFGSINPQLSNHFKSVPNS